MLENWSEYINQNDLDKIRNFVSESIDKNKDHNTIMIFCGTGSNGKTTMINEIMNIVGKQNCEHSAFNAINCVGGDHYISKKLLIFNDIDTLDTKMESVLKQLTSNDKMTTRRLYEDSICMKPKSNIIIETNKMFGIPNTLLEKTTIINFEHKF